MGRKIFLDIGGHLGQSAMKALDPSLAFDEIHSFEPDPEFAAAIRGIADSRLHVHEAALSNFNGVLHLRGDNSHGGATVLDVATTGSTRSVACWDIADFLNRFDEADVIFIKINCEGGEVAIMERLCQTKVIPTIRSIVVYFDIIKVRWGYWKMRSIIKASQLSGLPLLLSDDVMVKHAGGIPNWLDLYPDDFPGRDGRAHIRQPMKRKLRYATRNLRSALGLTITWRH